MGEKRKTLYLLQAKPRRKWKHVLFVGLLTSILHGLMGIRSCLVVNSLGRCLHPLLVYSESLPAPLLGSLVSTEGVVIFSCKERWGMGIQGVLRLKINDKFFLGISLWDCYAGAAWVESFATLRWLYSHLFRSSLRAARSGNCLCWCSSLYGVSWKVLTSWRIIP